MSFLKSLGRPLVLFALFAIGIGLIWHVGRSLYPLKRGTVDAPAILAPEAEPRLPVSAPPLQYPPRAVQPRTLTLSGELRVSTTERGRFIATEPILFNSGASTMREASIPRLNKLAEFLIQHPGITLEIVGHTDNLGPEPVNQRVSAERAGLVMNYLITQGVDRLRLRSKGMGSLDPIESNDTQLGRQANRRIEFRITGDAGQ